MNQIISLHNDGNTRPVQDGIIDVQSVEVDVSSVNDNTPIDVPIPNGTFYAVAFVNQPKGTKVSINGSGFFTIDLIAQHGPWMKGIQTLQVKNRNTSSTPFEIQFIQ